MLRRRPPAPAVTSHRQAHGGDRSSRTGLGGTQVEGHHAVAELLQARRRRVRRLWVSPGHTPDGVVSRLAAQARGEGVPVHDKSPEALAAAALTNAPQGVIAWADPVEEVGLDDLLGTMGATVPFLVCLDGVTDPGNMGAVMRSAVCAGATGMVVGRHRSAPLTAAAVKAAAGAVEHLRIAVVPGVPSALGRLVAAGIWTVGLDVSGGDDIWSVPVLDGAVALVLGAEGRGLSVLAKQRCDVLVRIPQAGVLGSLNVAAAAAVACFEVARRRAR